jgi:hypothetical protein
MSLAGCATRSESIPIARKIHKKAKRQTQSNEFALFEKRYQEFLTRDIYDFIPEADKPLLIRSRPAFIGAGVS